MNKEITKEYILCSAILRKVSKPETRLHGVDIHRCEIGLRHCDIRDRFPNELYKSPFAQGFLTSKGRFVSRELAESIARACGQVKGELIGSVLTSEDLY